MNSVRIFVLGALAKGGPMHGHQIRRAAELDRMDLWSDVKPGSLYGALHRMAAEDLIEAVRTEQEGNFPARTVYRITDAGRNELIAHRDEALRTARVRPDPVDLAMQNTFDMPEEDLRAYLEERKLAYETLQSSWRQQQRVAEPHIHGMERMTFRHIELRIEAELKWHAELLDHLDKLLADEAEHKDTKDAADEH
ncbi:MULTISPECIES: PadR family transcriptional regulator [unclassified Nocardia]|uniref:PadR family transcriptional regulator n=1 Tax=unclassified Nocardia TaxID=2637762 RepID=UPI0035DE364A